RHVHLMIGEPLFPVTRDEDDARHPGDGDAAIRHPDHVGSRRCRRRRRRRGHRPRRVLAEAIEDAAARCGASGRGRLRAAPRGEEQAADRHRGEECGVAAGRPTPGHEHDQCKATATPVTNDAGGVASGEARPPRAVRPAAIGRDDNRPIWLECLLALDLPHLSPPMPRSGSATMSGSNEGASAPAIVTLTMNPAIDVSASVEYVTPDHKLRCEAPTYEPGGGGINVARAIRALGG